ncbi:MAG: hypothetical protein EA417_16965 [Gammaproteobacteria bacterium]|nr:MAG: hypothetical protein EA417_16965 [Gammaproteobacteria bacterium]
MTKNRVRAQLAALAATVALASPAISASDEALIERLVANGVLSAADAQALRQPDAGRDDLIRMLVERGALTGADAEVLLPEAPPERYAGLQFEPVEPLEPREHLIRANRFRVETADGQHRFGVRGRLMADYGRGSFDSELESVAREDGPIPKHGTIIRRARLGVLGVMWDNWEWQMEVDFRDEEVRFANAYVAYLFPQGRLAAGHFKEPFSMESSTSSRRLTFLERAAPVDALRPSREMGVLYETLIPRAYLGVGLFGGRGVISDRDVDEGYAFAARASFAPHLTDDSFVHLGAFYNYRKNAVDRDAAELAPVRLRTRTGVRALDLRLIGRTDLEGVDDLQRWGLEGAFGMGPFSLQAEYLRANVDLDRRAVEEAHGGNATDANSLTLDGYYVQASYFLTGEQRNYRAFSGDFGAQQVNSTFGRNGPGAWEIAARFATQDSSEHSRVGRGQKLDHWTLGLNWYPNPDMVFKLNAMRFKNERDGESAKGTVFAARAQYEF